MQRVPVVVFNNTQLTTSATGTSYSSPANTYTTISAATLNNTTGTARTATLHIVPSGGTASASNQVATALSVPASGSTPTIASCLIGQTLSPGMMLQALSDAGSAVSIFVSGYATTL